MARIDGQTALFVIPDRFSHIEYRLPRTILEELGATVTIATYSSEAVLGSDGNLVQPNAQLGDAHARDYDAIVFVGGSGVITDDPEVQRIVQEALAEDRVVAAICAAQGILTRAGVVEPREGSGPYLERDGRIITASGPIKSREFGAAIAAALGE
jgi:protease I